MLNKLKFITLAGNPEKWDAEMEALKNNGRDLIMLQESQHARGYCAARLQESMYGWGVRYASGLNGFDILLGSRGTQRTRAEAIKWGIEWANEDPDKREFFAYKEDLDKVDTFDKSDPVS